MMHRLAALFLALAVAPAPALSEPPLRLSAQVESVTRGLICAPPEGGRRPAPDTAAGWIHVPDVAIEIRAEGTTAPARLGTGFGLRFVLAGQEPVPVRYVVTHPPMPPEGITRQSWHAMVQPGVGEQVFFQFDTEDELQPGDWTIAAFSGEDELFHAGFEVVLPRDLPQLDGLCRGGALYSLSRTPPGAAG
ncbi:MAG: protein of unknown function containing DUF3859 domain [Rhodobacteraceae bacterium HLUCCA12]|nr:MAG: protein of unknown function containing DUF3859 domain [Rhodobacteraceae bacterium HLUCCA12]